MQFTYSGIALDLRDHQCFYEAPFELNIIIVIVIIVSTTIIIIAILNKVLSHKYLEGAGI